MIDTSRLYLPDPARAAGTNCGNVEAFAALLKRSQEDPDGFWADVAGELEWIRPWNAVREGDFPHFKYFVGGVSNPTLNLIDRHLARGAGDRLALVWEGEDGQQRSYTCPAWRRWSSSDAPRPRSRCVQVATTGGTT